MKIALRKCHTKKITGACGIINERESCWDFVDRLALVLRKYGHEVLIIQGNENLSDHDQTKQGCEQANNWGADIYVSFHMNGFSNPSARGCEYIVYDNSTTNVRNISNLIMTFMASLGIPFRREIINNEFWELKYTAMEASIVELLFVTNTDDVNIWNTTSWDKLVYGIANCFDKNIPINPPTENTNKMYRVITGSFKERTNAENRVNELKSKGFESFIEIK